MRCPFCRAQDTRVIDSRLASDQDQIRRRRECSACGERFTTYETAELSLPKVVKGDGSREPFAEAKLRAGMHKSLEKRPVSVEEIEASVSRIKHKLLVAGEREVAARDIGEWVMDELRRLDQVAYLRFASVYRSFEDVRAFREVIDRLEREPSPEEVRDQLPLLRDGSAGDGGH